MAIFETDGSTEINITPREFLDECNTVDLLKLKLIVMDKFYLVEEEDVEEPEHRETPRSYSQMKFNEALNTLRENWRSLSKAECDFIIAISKKYGSV